MSRFFVKNDSDSSSEEEDLLSSEEELLVSSSDEEQIQDDDDSDFFKNDDDDESDSDSDSDAPKGPSYFLKSSFLKGGKDSDSDSDDEGRKVVKSAKEKLFDDIKESIDKLDTAKLINNWINASSEFDKLGRLLTRSHQQNFGTPNIYILSLSELEEFLNEANNNEQDKKKIPADQSRAFNTLRQRVKRQIKEFQELIDLAKKSPELFESEEPVEIPSTSKIDDISTSGFATVGPSRNLSEVFQTLKIVSESRGKKNIDKFEQIQSLESLLEQHLTSSKTFELISIYQMLISVRFDASSNQTFMPLGHWKKNLNDINSLLKLLKENVSTYQVSELGKPTDDIDIEPETNSNGVKVIFGSVTSLIERLDDELTRSLQHTDPHSMEYVERLKDESSIYKLILKGQLYVESIATIEQLSIFEGNDQLSRIISRRLEHVYYKPNVLIESNEKDAWNDLDSSINSSIIPRDTKPVDLIEGLVDFLIDHSTDLHGKKALLSKIYYYAVNNDHQTANDLFLSSQLYATIHTADSSLQIMYNRALVQLGLSAFRVGLIDESQLALNEIANSQRSKELLGQGFNTKYPSQASVTEKQRLLPFHMHINLELLECVYMTSSLLIEIPALAQVANSPKDSKRKVSARSFKNKLDFHDRQYFTGPPESIKDHIIHASKALQKGDWSKAYELLSSIKIWKLFPNNAELLSMMKNQLQIEGLRTYIFTYKSIYSKLSVDLLSSNFKLDTDNVMSILNKMIQSGDISGSISEDKRFINFTTSEPQRTRLQELAIILNEKVGLLTEKNEKTSSNGRGKKSNQHQHPQDGQQRDNANNANREQSQQPQPNSQEEYISKFRFANVNSNNDEFQATA